MGREKSRKPGTSDLREQGSSFWVSNKIPLLLCLLVWVFYGNTLFNEYALDDGLVIYENPYTMQGISGIGDILSHDSYHGYYQQFGSEGELSGGRYRPLSIITFALEYEFFGKSPALSHFINVVLYAFTILLLWFLLSRYWLKNYREVAIVATVLFAIHPIHTEVVANIKSRDELLSLLFLFIAAIGSFRFGIRREKKQLLLAMAAYFLALLSKENGITFLAVFPLALILFTRKNVLAAVQSTLPFLLVAIAYIAIRLWAVGLSGAVSDDVMNDPFFFASGVQRFATVIVILLLYIKLLLFPHPLSYDYGFYQIPYYHPGDWQFIFSVIIHVGLLIIAFTKFRNKRVISFSILYYFITISVVSNLFVSLGGTMGERLIYHSSLGFAMGAGALLVYAGHRVFGSNLPKQKQAGWLILGLLIVLSGYKTITRNMVWKNNATLFLADVNAVPNSVKANNAAATASTEMADNATTETEKVNYLQDGLRYLAKAKSINPNLADIYMNEGVIYYRLEQWENAETAWNQARTLFPSHPKLNEYDEFLTETFYKEGLKAGADGDIDLAIRYLEKSARYGPDRFEIWYNLGGAYYSGKFYEKALESFEKALALNPNHTESIQGRNSCRQLLGLDSGQ